LADVSGLFGISCVLKGYLLFLPEGSMIRIRCYREEDAENAGRLIAETYSRYNLSFASAAERAKFLGPFQHAGSDQEAHKKEIARVLRADMVFVAEDNGEIVGILRGQHDKLQSLFVSGAYHRQGIGRRLVERFERECRRQNSAVIKLRSTLFAVPFYQAMGYKKSTGVRVMKSFDGKGLPFQAMKKVLREE